MHSNARPLHYSGSCAVDCLTVDAETGGRWASSAIVSARGWIAQRPRLASAQPRCNARVVTVRRGVRARVRPRAGRRNARRSFSQARRPRLLDRSLLPPYRRSLPPRVSQLTAATRPLLSQFRRSWPPPSACPPTPRSTRRPLETAGCLLDHSHNHLRHPRRFRPPLERLL